jgi:hypothetical protein
MQKIILIIENVYIRRRVSYSYRRGLEMGEVKAARDRTFKGIQEIMEREGIDEEGAMVMILDLGLKDYVVELYRQGDVTIREAAAILGLNLRQTLEIVEKKIGGNVGREEAIRALELAKKLAEK